MIAFLMVLLMEGMVAIVVLYGNNGFVNALGLGTSTSETIVKGGFPVAIATTVIVAIIIRVVGGRKRRI